MNRRSFLTKMFATAAVAAVAPTSLVYAAPQAYNGELLLTIAARGAGMSHHIVILKKM